MYPLAINNLRLKQAYVFSDTHTHTHTHTQNYVFTQLATLLSTYRPQTVDGFSEDMTEH
jgi:hypothetical protein